MFYDITKCCLHIMNLNYRYVGPWPSDEDLAYTMTSAAPRSVEKKNCLGQIEH